MTFRRSRSGPAEQRAAMVAHDLAPRGVVDERVLAAMGTVPREEFVPEALADRAYDDRPLPIAAGQTISQPLIVAMMTQAAEISEGDRVLEIGTGSGYAAAVLAEVGAEVWTIERHAALVEGAKEVLGRLGYGAVHVIEGDGSLGHAEAAPYDAIVVTAGAPSVPPSLLDQLAEGGRLVMPVGPSSWGQELVRLRRVGDELVREDLGGVRFVPLIGAEGVPE